jgi:hypothetical protein
MGTSGAAGGFRPPPKESDHTLGYAESRPVPLDYSELRGEGSTPVPLPPPTVGFGRLDAGTGGCMPLMAIWRTVHFGER